MLHKKLFLVLALFCLYNNTLYSQTQVDSVTVEDDADTTAQTVVINKIMPRKKGVYKNYLEYLNNTPSIEADFTVTPIPVSKKNSLVAEAKIEFEGERLKKIWGVCDGEYVYIRVITADNILKGRFFRLQCDGPAPYIFLVEKPIFAVGGIGSIATLAMIGTSAALPPFVSVFLVRSELDKKPVYEATHKRVINLLKEYPDLLQAYENETQKNKATKVKYLTLYNQKKLGKS
jgi:hypothetical protein